MGPTNPFGSKLTCPWKQDLIANESVITMLVEVIRHQFLTNEAALMKIIGGGTSTTLISDSTRREGYGPSLGAAPVPMVEDTSPVQALREKVTPPSRHLECIN